MVASSWLLILLYFISVYIYIYIIYIYIHPSTNQRISNVSNVTGTDYQFFVTENLKFHVEFRGDGRVRVDRGD